MIRVCLVTVNFYILRKVVTDDLAGYLTFEITAVRFSETLIRLGSGQVYHV